MNYTYTEMPSTITVATSDWKKAVEDCVVKYGVRWNNPHYFGDNPESSSNEQRQGEVPGNDGPEPKRRKRLVAHIWYTTYTCHRSGNYRDRVAEGAQVRGGSSGKARELQKASKKNGCTAKLKITCYKSDPNNVVIQYKGPHNHEVGGLDDLKYLPLSETRKTQIMERLREGYSRRDCRIAIQKDFTRFISEYLNLSTESAQTIHRDQMVHADEVYNLYKKIEEAFYRKATDEQESVSLWLKELEEKNYSIFKTETFNEDFTFGFASPWQKLLLLSAKAICLDATHCVSHIDRGLLYTVVMRHPVTGTGCPVAYMFTKDHSMVAVAAFLSFVKNDIGLARLEKITIDVSATEHAAITAVYPEATVQWCLFHVSRAWMGKIRELIKLGSTALNNQVHREVIRDLKALQWEKNQSDFLLKWLAFYQKYSAYSEFMNYMDRNYLNREKFVHWSAAYQPQVYTNMETNNFIESWHNQLKTIYLGRKRNRRVDRLIYVLVNDVEHDYIANIERISLNIGRMGPEERRRRRRELAAEKVNEDILPMMVNEPEAEGNVYKVQSFSSETHFYEIEVVHQKMKACTCEDFKYNSIACKHMYLLKRVYRNIDVFTRKLEKEKNKNIGSALARDVNSRELLATNLLRSALREEQRQVPEPATASTVSSSSEENVAQNLLTNIKALVNTIIEHNQRPLTEENIQKLLQVQSLLTNVSEDSSPLPPNTNFTTQRR